MNGIDSTQPTTPCEPPLRSRCLTSCRKLLAQIARTKAATLQEFHKTLQAPQHLLHLALNEAEALAWESGVPQLVFPTLAREKVQAVAAWHARQQFLHRRDVAEPLDDRRASIDESQ
jgi:hypothetical protein